jgi:hypothetical protein
MIATNENPPLPLGYLSLPRTHWKYSGKNLGWFLVCDICLQELTNDPVKAERLIKTHNEVAHAGRR